MHVEYIAQVRTTRYNAGCARLPDSFEDYKKVRELRFMLDLLEKGA
jgi:hypothetical protein